MEIKKLNEKLIFGIKKFFKETNKDKAVLGLSGGIDSALVLSLLCESIGNENVTALLMPNKKITKNSNTIDAERLAKKLKIKYYIIQIDSFIQLFENLSWEQNKIAKANTNARIRAILLYNFANSTNSLVAGTGNKTEINLGYFTKYGDAAADFFSIGALLKTQVRELAKYRNLPQEFLDKNPSAELWVGQEDEKEFGMAYTELDLLLPLILENKEIPLTISNEKIKKIKTLISSSQHKREQPKIIEV